MLGGMLQAKPPRRPRAGRINLNVDTSGRICAVPFGPERLLVEFAVRVRIVLNGVDNLFIGDPVDPNNQFTEPNPLFVYAIHQILIEVGPSEVVFAELAIAN